MKKKFGTALKNAQLTPSIDHWAFTTQNAYVPKADILNISEFNSEKKIMKIGPTLSKL